MIEVLKQMTEALEDITRLLQGITGGAFSKLDAAIQAGRKAIAELESQEPVALKKGECWPEEVMRQWDYWRKEIANGHKGSAPRDWFEGLSELKLIDTPPQRTEQNFCPRCGKRTNDIHTCTPPQGIYYTPPQRTWVGLTKEQLATTDWSADFRAGALWAEAKLKQKNGFAEEKNT